MTDIITTNLSTITLSSQFLVLQSPNGEIEVDIKKLLKEPINSENAYFNATKIAKQFNKPVADYLRYAGKDYIAIVADEFKHGEITHLKLKTHYAKRGKYHSGTWLHKEIFLDFCRWLDKSFARKMDLTIKELIIHSNELKIERKATKFHFKGLTDIIKDVYIPAQQSDDGKKWAYHSLSTMINIAVFGCKGAKYIKDNGLDPEIPIRDQLTKSQVSMIDDMEKALHGYIKYAEITDYEELKIKLIGGIAS